MNKLLQQIELIERVDRLVRLKATGSPKKLAEKLDLSESSLYRLLDTIKDLGAPVEFSADHESYVYGQDVKFKCGFFLKELSQAEFQKVNDGFQSQTILTLFNT